MMLARYVSPTRFAGSHGRRVACANTSSDIRALHVASDLCRIARLTYCSVDMCIGFTGCESLVLFRNSEPERATRLTTSYAKGLMFIQS